MPRDVFDNLRLLHGSSEGHRSVPRPDGPSWRRIEHGELTIGVPIEVVDIVTGKFLDRALAAGDDRNALGPDHMIWCQRPAGCNFTHLRELGKSACLARLVESRVDRTTPADPPLHGAAAPAP